MSIRDYSKVLTITDGTTGLIIDNVPYVENYEFEKAYIPITLRDYQLLYHIKNLVDRDQHDVFIRLGYKS